MASTFVHWFLFWTDQVFALRALYHHIFQLGTAVTASRHRNSSEHIRSSLNCLDYVIYNSQCTAVLCEQTSHKYLLLACSATLHWTSPGWNILSGKHYNLQLRICLPCWPAFLDNSILRVWSQRTNGEEKWKYCHSDFFSFGEMNTYSLQFLFLKYHESSLIQVSKFGCGTVKTFPCLYSAIYTFR